MGNKLDAESVRYNLSEYKLDASNLELISSINSSTNSQRSSTVFIWKNKVNGMRLIEKKYFLRTWLQFYDILQMFALRYNDPYLLAASYLSYDSDVMEKISTSNVFSDTWVSIFYEESISNLSHLKEIPQEDAAYFLLQSLKGFEKIVQKTKLIFQVKQSMFHINQSRQIKVWLCQSIWESQAINSVRALASESQMVNQILSIIQKNIYFCTESQKNITQNGRNYMQPIVIEQAIRKAPQTIKEAIQLIERHLQSDEVQVGRQMSCLKDLSQDQLNVIMEMAKIKNNQAPPSNQLFTPQNNFISNIHDRSLESDVFVTNQNYFESQPISKTIQRNLSLQNIESVKRVFESGPGVKVSRQKSNKKCGLSLIRKKDETEIQKSRNHASMLVIKPRPQSSFNQQSTNIIQRNHALMTRNTIENKHQNDVRNVSKQNRESVNPLAENRTSLRKRSNLLSNVQNIKGISLTQRNESLNKSRNTVAVQNSENQKIMFSLQNSEQRSVSILKLDNENRSLMQNNSSTITIGSFPTPVYINNSLMRPCTPNQKITLKKISQNMSFDPILPNQSLTRFQKEFVMSPNVNSSGQEFYEIPKIYVHSPKAKNKIFKTEMGSFQSHFRENQFFGNQQINQNVFHENKVSEARKDFVKETHEQKSDWKQNKFKQYQSYIHQNQSLFTHPVLYEYITNSSNGFAETQEIKVKEKKPYVDYLTEIQISESLDYNTVEKLFEANSQPNRKQKLQNLKDISPQHYSINDFPTIEEIQENPNDEYQEKQNISFLPIPLNLTSQPNGPAPQSNLIQRPPSSVRRGYEESVVVEYKKFYDDTNRSSNSPNKHYFSPLKKKSIVLNQTVQALTLQEMKKYETADNWKTSPSKPMVQRPSSALTAIYQNNQIGQLSDHRNSSPSPLSKIIYRGVKPAINPLLMQDIQKIRQQRIF